MSAILCLSIDLQISQRLYEWRNGIGSGAICIVNSFFTADVHDGAFDTNEARVAFSEHMLYKCRFAYSNGDSDDSSVRNDSAHICYLFSV
jgi:hypothetical protein